MRLCTAWDCLLLADAAGDEHERNSGVRFARDGERRHAAEAGRAVVGKNDVGRELRERADELRFAVDHPHLESEARLAQLARQQFGIGGHALDDQDAQLRP